MNSLSWLLYAAEVIDNLQTFGTVVTVGLLLAAGGTAVFGPMIADMNTGYDEKEKVDFRAFWSRAWKMTIAAVILGGIVSLVPSKQTVMLIAASEVGETVLASDKVQEIGGEAGALATDSLRVLRKFINEQLGAAE